MYRNVHRTVQSTDDADRTPVREVRG